ncbi:MAG: YdcF family protein [Kibdelosporangium sp.]
MVLGFVALAAVLIFIYRVYREPRRLGNAVWLGVAVVFTGLWLLTRLSGTLWQTVVVVAAAVVVALIVLVLPWALIANGVVMWRREGRRLANLLSLLAGLAMVGLFVLTVLAVRFSGSRWLITTAMALVLVAGYLAFLFVALLAYSVLYSRLGRRTNADAIIVLGAGLHGDQVPPLLASRLDRAIQCREQATGTDPVIVVSGGRGSDELVSEAEAMGEYLSRAGVPADRILLEDKAATTQQNLRFSVALLAEHGHSGKILAVTNNYHVFRTAVLSRSLGLKLNVVGARTASYFVPSAFLREFVALLAQYWRTNLVAIVLLMGGPVLLAVLSG